MLAMGGGVITTQPPRLINLLGDNPALALLAAFQKPGSHPVQECTCNGCQEAAAGSCWRQQHAHDSRPAARAWTTPVLYSCSCHLHAVPFCSVHAAALFPTSLPSPVLTAPGALHVSHFVICCRSCRSTSTVTVRCGRMTACARTGLAVCVNVARMRCPCLGWQLKPSPARPHRALTATVKDVSTAEVYHVGVWDLGLTSATQSPEEGCE
jgi:hypothetical protein